MRPAPPRSTRTASCFPYRTLFRSDVFYIPTPISLAVVTLILGVSVIASLIATRGQARRVAPAPENPPFRIVTPDEIAATTSLRSEEHTSELQSLMRISYDVFCLKNKNI